MARLPSAIVGLAGSLRGMARTLWPFTTVQAYCVVQGTRNAAAPRFYDVLQTRRRLECLRSGK